MTTLILTRPPASRPASIASITDRLTRRLHAQVHPRRVEHGEHGMTVTCDVTAPVDRVRLACAEVVKAPVECEVRA